MKKLKLKNCRLEFMIKPILVLSVISIPVYVMKLLKIETADMFFSAMVFAAVIFSLIYNFRERKKIFFVIAAALILIIFYISFYDNVINILIKISNKSAIKFGIINTAFNTFGLYDFQNFADYTSFGGSFFISNKIVCGAVNIFKANPESGVVSQFLTARFLLLFSLCGIAFSIGRKNINICLIAIISLLTGNYTALLLLFAFVYPVYYLLILIASFACSFTASAVSIKLGFFCAPSIFELFIHNSNRVYAVVVCVLVFSVSYYFASLVKEKLK